MRENNYNQIKQQIKGCPEFRLSGDEVNWTCVTVDDNGMVTSFIDNNNNSCSMGTGSWDFVINNWFATRTEFKKLYPKVEAQLAPFKQGEVIKCLRAISR